MAGYGWDEYSARTGGRQTIHDAENHIDISTQFAKIPGGSHGGSWGVRVNGKLRDDAPPQMASTAIFYLALEGLGELRLSNEEDDKGYEGSVILEGETADLGQFKIEITPGPSLNQHPPATHPIMQEKPLDRTQVTIMKAPANVLWQAKELFLSKLRQGWDAIKTQFGEENPPPPAALYTLPTSEEPEGNFYMVQKTFSGSWQFDVLYSSKSAPEETTSSTLGKALKDSSASFAEYYSKYLPANSPFDKPKYDRFGKSLLSNLLGGVGFFYGDQVIDRSYADEYEEENEGFWEEAVEAKARNQQQLEGPYKLFTSVPSRPFFPRGFLWDEGFHLLPIADFDVGVTLEIIRSWFQTMDEDGWIPREQILGDEARSKVPPEFQIQYPHYANPPTLFLALEQILDRLDDPKSNIPEAERSTHKSTILSIYPLVKRNIQWYRKTQRGDLKSYDRPSTPSREAYRWRGRTVTHIFTSGLDDYPRTPTPHPGELHLDLISWMGMASRAIKRIATYLGETDDASQFAGYEADIRANIDVLHWNKHEQTFCDATVDEYEETVHVCHRGYVSIFPFITGLMSPPDPHLGAVLDLIGDPGELWSPYGIGSLSKKDEHYGTAENYWRSSIWMNINYLIIDNLLKIAKSKGPHQAKALKMYNELRVNLVETVYKSWEETGFAWEQYNPDDGHGQRTQHFTGWSSLVVKIMGMPDLKGVKHGEL